MLTRPRASRRCSGLIWNQVAIPPCVGQRVVPVEGKDVPASLAPAHPMVEVLTAGTRQGRELGLGARGPLCPLALQSPPLVFPFPHPPLPREAEVQACPGLPPWPGPVQPRPGLESTPSPPERRGRAGTRVLVSVHFSACDAVSACSLHPGPGFMERHVFSMFLNKN